MNENDILIERTMRKQIKKDITKFDVTNRLKKKSRAKSNRIWTLFTAREFIKNIFIRGKKSIKTFHNINLSTFSTLRQSNLSLDSSRLTSTFSDHLNFDQTPIDSNSSSGAIDSVDSK